MEAIILSKDQYTELVARLDEITTRLNAKNEPKKDTFLDNQEFLILMKISKRTAQTWRDEGRISFLRKKKKMKILFGMFVPFCLPLRNKCSDINFKNQKMSKLENKVTVVTGGSSGIGFATAKEFVAQGAKVVITGRNQQALDEAVKQLGSNAIGIHADAANLNDTEKLVEQVKSTFGKVDILLVNAGVGSQEPIGQIKEETFDTVVGINFKGAVFTTEKFIPILVDGASVIHLASVAAFLFSTANAVYSASKAALVAYSKTAAVELANRKIRVNVVEPAMTETPLIHSGAFDNDETHAFLKDKFMPFKRYGEPEEVAKLVTFLASDDASFISGGEFTIDSGASINAVRL